MNGTVLFCQSGKFTSISDAKNLRSAMATYYDFFSRNAEKDRPIISVPYVDAFGSGNNIFSTLSYFYLLFLLFLINVYFSKVQ